MIRVDTAAVIFVVGQWLVTTEQLEQWEGGKLARESVCLCFRSLPPFPVLI
jgi:hypothetical protein